MCLSQEGGMNEIIEIIEYFLKVVDSSAPILRCRIGELQRRQPKSEEVVEVIETLAKDTFENTIRDGGSTAL